MNKEQFSNRLAGFIDLQQLLQREGTFFFKNLSPFFQVGQNVRSLYVLEVIANYLQSIAKGFKFSLRSEAPNVINSLNKKLMFQ